MSVVAVSDATLPAPVTLGGVHFRITDPDACAFAIATGALAEGEPLVCCLRAVFTPTEPGNATPCAGDVVALPDDDGLAVLFTVAAVHASVQARGAYDLERDAIGNEILQPGEVLLVQLISSPEEEQS